MIITFTIEEEKKNKMAVGDGKSFCECFVDSLIQTEMWATTIEMFVNWILFNERVKERVCVCKIYTN